MVAAPGLCHPMIVASSYLLIFASPWLQVTIIVNLEFLSDVVKISSNKLDDDVEEIVLDNFDEGCKWR